VELKSSVPPGPLDLKWSRHKFDMKLVSPANKRKFSVIVVGSGLAGASAAASLAEQGYKGHLLLLPGQPAAGALDRRAGRDQRGQELPERRRQHRAALLRHRQGRRLPRPRGQRPPPRRGVGRHHRPVRGAGRAIRPRVRRHAGQPVVRRRPGLADLLRAGPDRPAAPAGALPGPGAAGRRRRRDDVLAPRDAGVGRRRRPRARHRHARPGHRPGRVARRRRRHPGQRRLRHRLLPGHVRQGGQHHGHLAARTRRARPSQPCYTQIHPTCIPSPASTRAS
jgi:hypothetical protein